MSAAIASFKYAARTELSIPLGQLLTERVQATLRIESVNAHASSAGVSSRVWNLPDIICPVPLHWRKRCTRGFNPSALLANELARSLKVPFVLGIERVRHTPAQAGQDAMLRAQNVKGVFRAAPRAVANRHVWIVDDVKTTGATLSECIGAVIAAGARSAKGLALAGVP